MSENTKTAGEMAVEVKSMLDKAVDKVKGIAEDALGKAKSGESMSKAAKEQADELLVEMNGLKASFTELEQKMARGGNTQEQELSLGKRFVDTEDFKSFMGNQRSGTSASMDVKADITTATTGAGGVGAAITPNRLPGILALPQRRMTIRNLLMPGTTDGPIVEYVQETGFTNNAAPVAEGALKPQSDITLTDKSINTKVIAHWFRVSKQTLSDVSQIQSLIDNRLLYGLAFAEEQQLLNGDGTGDNLLGIIPQASAYAAPAGAAAATTSFDVLRLGMLQAVLAEYPATGHVLNPINWANIELLKDGDGRYIIGNPQGVATPTLWGLPVVTTQAISVGKFLTGAFDMGAQVFDQWRSRIETGFQNDDFVKNKVTILAEERLALAVYRPEAFIYGDVGVSTGE